jgi:hypothetical protein
MTDPPIELAVTLRYGFPDDAEAIARLADLDSAPPPAQPTLLAEVAGEPRAAVSLRDGAVVADPFHPTRALVELLQARAAQLQVTELDRRHRCVRLRARRGLAAWR